jgi:hypothetical protein
VETCLWDSQPALNDGQRSLRVNPPLPPTLSALTGEDGREAKDATGAGDAFIGGFLYAWLGWGGDRAQDEQQEGLAVAAALTWACRCGCANVQREGAAQALSVEELLHEAKL